MLAKHFCLNTIRLLNPFKPSDSGTSTVLTGPFSIESVSCCFLLLPCFIEILVFNANRVEADQMLHSVTSDLPLHCLSMCLVGYCINDLLTQFPVWFLAILL